jgi:hypothetical protein
MAVLLPGARARLVDPSGITDAPWYRWFQVVNKALNDGQISDADAAAAIRAIALALGSPDGSVENIPSQDSSFILNGSQAVEVTGTPASGFVDLDLSDTGVAAGDYGKPAPSLVAFSVDAKGRLISASQAELIAGNGISFDTDPDTGAITISVNSFVNTFRITQDGSTRVTRAGNLRVTR